METDRRTEVQICSGVEAEGTEIITMNPKENHTLGKTDRRRLRKTGRQKRDKGEEFRWAPGGEHTETDMGQATHDNLTPSQAPSCPILASHPQGSCVG